MSTPSGELWDAIRELVIACGGSAGDFPEEITDKITTAVEDMKSEAYWDGMSAADGD